MKRGVSVMPKRSIRERLLRERRQCSPENCLQLSLEIQSRLLGEDCYRKAACLGLYSAILNEVATEQLALRAWLDGKRVVYPRLIADDHLAFFEAAGFSDLSPGAFGILEPAASRPVPLESIDLLVVPGVAFDLEGHRLGYGRGCYDRVLSGCRSGLEKVGLAYEFQVVEKLPVAGHDCRISRLVTERRTVNFVF